MYLHAAGPVILEALRSGDGQVLYPYHVPWPSWSVNLPRGYHAGYPTMHVAVDKIDGLLPGSVVAYDHMYVGVYEARDKGSAMGINDYLRTLYIGLPHPSNGGDPAIFSDDGIPFHNSLMEIARDYGTYIPYDQLEKWLRKSEQGDKWNRCLIEGMIVLSETGARDEQTTPP